MSLKPLARKWWCLALLLPAALGCVRLRFNVDVLDLLPVDLPVVQGLKLYQQYFSNARELMVTVQAANADAAEAAARRIAERLRQATNLVESAWWQPPWLEHPEQTAELVAHLWFNLPPSVFGELTNRLAPPNLPRVLAATRDELATTLSPADLARLSYDPFGLARLPETVVSAAPSFAQGQELFASPDGKFRLVFVRARSGLVGYRECAQWLDQVKALVHACVPPAETNTATTVVGYTGRPAYVAEISAGMKRDMTGSVVFTATVIAVLFWLAHRRWAPMFWLLALLGLILLGTLALGGLVFGAIDVVSLGFAGILLGLAVDYGVVHYQEALASPRAIIPEIRRAIGPSIFWAATTTISAFLVLNFGGLPGLGQLGSLVAIGVGLSALVMLFAFLPPLFRDRMKARLDQIAAGAWPPGPSEEPAKRDLPEVPPLRAKLVGALSVTMLLTGVAVFAVGWPRLDHSADVLRPHRSAADAALREIQSHLIQGHEPLWLILRGRTELEVANRLEAARTLLDRAVSNHWITHYALPSALWPRPDHQVANRPAARRLAAARSALRAAALKGGFTANALEWSDRILDVWQTAATGGGVFWPTNDLSRWILDKVATRTDEGWVVVGYVFTTADDGMARRQLERWSDELAQQGYLLAGWDLLGDSVLARVERRIWLVMTPMVLLVLASLWLAFRRVREVLLSLVVLASSALLLLAVMRSAGWSWNLLNLMALPLVLGTGVDYSIFMQLALRRHGGDLAATHRSVGRALLLCGGTAVAGFGSLAGSNYGGMASLGEICAVGIAGNMLLSIFLLPVWWRWLSARDPVAPLSVTDGRPALSKPSLFYRAGIWRLGLIAGRLLPKRMSEALGRWGASCYCAMQPHRREVVVQNLLPVLDGDRAATERAAEELFQAFALKVADLWRYESGRTMEGRPTEWSGWDILTAAQARAKGVLLVTPHLGNWEIGGALLAQHGFKLLVLTQAEPERRLTALRLNSRARWGVETLVIGEDAFAFVDIIKRLQAGATVALLVDRPAPSTAVTVEFFGRPFAASIAAAELARATGCAVVPVYVVRNPAGHSAHVLPEVVYDRAALGDRVARIRLTREILRAFEPIIRQHVTQWYHFVPIWPHASTKTP